MYTFKFQDEHFSDDYSDSSDLLENARFAKYFLSQKFIYRKFELPKGGVDVPTNQAYSIHGYLVPSAGASYRFIAYVPLYQHWRIDSVSAIILYIEHINLI